MVTNTKLQYVIDASVIFGYLMIDETIPNEMEQIIIKHGNNEVKLYAPNIIRFEVGNCFHNSILRKRINLANANKLATKFSDLGIVYQDTAISNILTIATSKQLSYYDAAYLSLKNTLHCPLLTLDKKLAALSR